MTLSEALNTSYAPLDEPAIPPESDLLARLSRGEPTAVAEIYDAHHATVRVFARRLLCDAAAAEDLVHDVFVELPRAIRGFRGDASLRTFVVSIAVNTARHHVRAAARRRAAHERLGREPLPETSDPEYETHRRELAQRLSRALDTLSLEQRVTFVLCEIEERTSREAATIVGVPEATIRTRLFHAKRKLRVHLEKEASE
jgi:RNA polymerase sigma-70 factor (ECF subfamily)